MSNAVEKTNGPGFIGYTIGLCLYGTTLAQSMFFFRDQTEKKAMKTLVSVLCILDTIHIYLLTSMFWKMATSERVVGNGRGLSWQQVSQFGVAFLITFIVQCFFGLRVWRVSHKNIFVTLVIGIASLTQFGAGMAFEANVIQNSGPRGFSDHQGHKTGGIELISSMVCDLTISGSLTYYFHSYRIGRTRTDIILHELIIISVNMGVLLCVVTAINLALFEMKNGAGPSLAPHIILSKLYVNSLLATLNTRKHFREIVSRAVEVSLPLADVQSSQLDSQLKA